MSEHELDRFRREWRAEVRARDRPEQDHLGGPPRHRRSGSQAGTDPQDSRVAPAVQRRLIEDDRLLGGGWNFDDLEEQEEKRKLGVSGDGAHPESTARREPTTALEFYEQAVESENQGKMGESVAHYRRAFRLNDRVDQQYKNKHFPPTAFKAQTKHTKPASSSVGTVGTSLIPAPSQSGEQQDAGNAFHTLIANFAEDLIQGRPPVIARDTPPPCSIALLPTEILSEILRFAALRDVSAYARMSLVCKRLAYLVATESNIWKELCLQSDVGFNRMHFDFACSLEGTPMESHVLGGVEDLSLEDRRSRDHEVEPAPALPPLPEVLALSPSFPSYAVMFRHRPRIRFAGVYISTVNYTRPGVASPNSLTWNSPIHVVTYYRYLRFYRDGSCMSLLTTVEPLEVVPYFHVEHIGATAGALASAGLAAVGRYTLRGRWRMSALHRPPRDKTEDSKEDTAAAALEPEGNVLVETYGPTPPLVYHMQLALRSNSGRGPKNTKLVWRGFWSYNKITDDWAEFGLRNDRAYVWSRVKSWNDA